jgi:hypothetical protein
VEMPLDTLVAIIVRKVLDELAKRGVSVTGNVPGPSSAAKSALHPENRMEVDMTGYKTPVLTENRVRGAGPHIREIAVPAGTIVTAGARDLLQQRGLKLTFISPQH